MQVGSFWVITMNTLKGPWHVTNKGNIWYIINILTGTTKKIGKVRGHGTNYCDRAKDIAKERNAVFFSKEKQLPQYLGRYPELDAAISEVLQKEKSNVQLV